MCMKGVIGMTSPHLSLGYIVDSVGVCGDLELVVGHAAEPVGTQRVATQPGARALLRDVIIVVLVDKLQLKPEAAQAGYVTSS